MSTIKPKLLNTEIVYRGRVFDVKLAEIDDDGLIYKREIIEHGGSAVVLPVHKNGEISLVRQYRHPTGQYLLEIPAGTVEPGETPEECAGREIEEETGYVAAKLEQIAEFYVSPGFLSEKMHLFVATDLTKTAPDPDDDENIDVVRLKIATALQLIKERKIQDAKTIIGILMVSGQV